MNEARFYKINDSGSLSCTLCPHHCSLGDGEYGKCNVRINVSGALKTIAYGKLSSIAMDPVEKKPLYHFYPGREILSMGSYGCTMHCEFCQNSSISQCNPLQIKDDSIYRPADIISMAKSKKCGLIAFTYNEPVTFYEFVYDVSMLAVEEGIQTAMVSNGFIMEDALRELLPNVSAFNIDVKSYDNNFYKRYTGATLAPVLKTLDVLFRSSKHIEITYLLIPGLNDDPVKFSALCKELKKIAGDNLVMHISRYFPRYRMSLPPTSVDSLLNFIDIARNEFHYVYPGNVGQEHDSNTYCPECSSLLIKRSGYFSIVQGISGGNCKQCGRIIYGKF